MAHESVSPVCLYRCAASGLHLGPSDAFLLGAAFSSPSCLQFLLLFVETFLFLRKQVTEEIQKKKKKLLHFKQDILDGSAGKESACNAEDIGGTSLAPGSGRSPEKRKWLSTPVFLPGESHGQRILVAYSPKRQKESDTTKHTNTARENTQTYATVIQCLFLDKAGPPNNTCYQLLSTYWAPSTVCVCVCVCVYDLTLATPPWSRYCYLLFKDVDIKIERMIICQSSHSL